MQTYNLNADTIRRLLGRGVVGAYFLGDMRDDTFVPGYVGRSDGQLMERLLCHARTGRFQRFSIVPTETLLQAFRIECREWHRLNGLVNRIHPDAPRWLPYACPYCIAAKEIAAGLGRN